MLRDRGVDPFVVDDFGATALTYACYRQQYVLGNLLLEHFKEKVDIEHSDSCGRSYLAASYWDLTRNS